MRIGAWQLAARQPQVRERFRYLLRLWLNWLWVRPLLVPAVVIGRATLGPEDVR